MVQDGLRSKSLKELPSLLSGLLLDPYCASAEKVSMSNARLTESLSFTVLLGHGTEAVVER